MLTAEKRDILDISGFYAYERMTPEERKESDKLYEELFPEKVAAARARGVELRRNVEASKRIRPTLEWMNPPPDNILPYPKKGSFFIDGLTQEEYKAWMKAGVPFIDADGSPIQTRS